MVGSKLSHYEITDELGRGGMGIVYKATDTNLNRTVAVKVLPTAALANDDDRARFFREAQAAAQLHHPNIATVFGIEEAVPVDADGNEVGASDGPRLFIAMEFIDGESLHDYVKKGPLPLSEAVNISVMIAEALKAAHAKDIVHRDVKSANVMLTGEGVAKVLDFGLAKTNQSTMLTRMGSTLGTVAYMSPEQARGQEVDGRSDLYSLGTILYEMVTGQLPYGGDYEQAILYGILNETPEPLTAKRTGVPMGLEWIVNKLLSKEADYRYQTAADLLADLKTVDLSGSGMSRRSMPAMSGAVSGSMEATAESGPTATGSSRLPRWVYGVVAAALLVGLGFGWVFKPNPETDAPPVRKFTLELPSLSFTRFPVGESNGKYWAFFGVDSTGGTIRLWDTENNSIRSIPGSQGLTRSGFSPDGAWIAMSNRSGLFRARVPSGSALNIAPEGEFIWMDSENILVAAEDSLAMWNISVEDQNRTVIDLAAVDTIYTEFYYYEKVGSTSIVLLTADYEGDKSDILAVDLRSGSVHPLIRGACCAKSLGDDTIIYLTGSNVFNNEGQLVAQRFDAGRISLEGVPVDVLSESINIRQFGVGDDDSFLLFPDQIVSGVQERLSWVDAVSNRAELTDFPPANYDRLSFSPDGSMIAMERSTTEGPDAGNNIYLFDLEANTEQRLTYTVPVNRVPNWTKSGKIYFAGGPPQNSSIYVKNADGTGSETMLVEDGDFPTVSPDEKWLVYVRQTNTGDLFALNLETGEEIAIDTTAFRTNDPAVSPNGRYIAYSQGTNTNNVVGADQRIFIRSFPDPTRFRVQAIKDFADDPFWSLDGKYLYYRANGNVKRIEVDTGDAFRPLSAPEDVISFPSQTIRVIENPTDGRLLVVHQGQARQASGRSSVEVILSFSSYLDKLFGTTDQ